jgi:hypothetical protein
MPTPEFLQLLVVALVAGYIGYLLGRASTRPLAEASQHPTESPPLGGEPATGSRRSATPPPASASGAGATADRTVPRRSSAPPPAAAGLMKRDE